MRPSVILSLVLVTSVFGGCLGEPLPDTRTSSSTSPTTTTSTLVAEELVSQEAAGARIRFRAMDFYGLTFPHPSTRCAGDTRTYLKLYDLNASSGPTLADLGFSLHGEYAGSASYTASVDTSKDIGPVSFQNSTVVSSQTIRPEFIRNVGVDITDANAAVVGNNASSCSLPTTAVPTSTCATFDFGNAGGLPTSLGGTIFFLGGIHTNTKGSTTHTETDARAGYNYAGHYDTSAPYTTYLDSSASTTFSAGAPRSHTVSCGPQAPSSVLGATNTYQYFVNRCDTFMYTLGVDRLPASSADGSSTSFAPGLSAPPSNNEPITIWGNLKPTNSTVSAPRFVAGAAAAYSTALNQVLLFGGSAPIGMTSATTESSELAETWVYDIKKQAWEKLDAPVTVDPLITRHTDLQDVSGVITAGYEIEKDVPGHAYFGAAAVPYTTLASLPTNRGTRSWALDTTERIFTVGGKAGGVEDRDTHRFNPTFGPEYMDSGDAATAGTFPANLPISTGTSAGKPPAQWLDPNATTLVTNRYVNFDPNTAGTRCFTETVTTTTDFISIFGPRLPSEIALGSSATCGLANLFTLATGRRTFAHSVVGLFGNTSNTNVIGHFLSLAGFSSAVSSIPTDIFPSFRPEILTRTQGVDGQAINHAAQFSMVSNQPDGTRRFPGLWHPLGLTSAPFPFRWYGATNALPGLTRGTDLVYFGGTKCISFALDNSDSNCQLVAGELNPGAIVRYDGAELSSPSLMPNATTPTTLVMTGSTPTRGGMAAARGYTSAGAPIIVAWGGLDRPLVETGPSPFYILTFDGSGNGTWSTATSLVDAPAPSFTYASMVYSHVTRKFYLFGGVQYAGSRLQNNADTFEITVTGTTAPFSATFRKLSPLCAPSCPSGRRAQQMVEVNYHADPAIWAVAGGAWSDYQPGIDHCTPGAPCSFGIFMEGGTSTGTDLQADRWLFDPTANGGQGLWQRVDSFPARKLAHSASLKITPATDVIAGASATGSKNYVLLFGGESGLSNPAMIPTAGSGYVAPTFGDTWLFDFGDKKWHRVRLAGRGYETSAAPTTAAGYTEFQVREQFLVNYAGNVTRPQAVASGQGTGSVTDANLNVLTPPPLAGGMMVVRTHNGPRRASNPANAGSQHRIPEVFLIGGRKKDGTLMPFGEVYKFCVGTSGERIATSTGSDPYNDGSCDAYDPVKNLESTSPLADYVGRWLLKTPTAPAPATSPRSFLGAAAYDPDLDVIAVFGGLNGTTSTSTASVSDTFFAYTPPKTSVTSGSPEQGSWTTIGNCALTSPATAPSPEARYGHSMHYDLSTHQYVIVGGYDANGKPLTSTITSTRANTSYLSPQIWVGKRIESAADLGTLNYPGYEIDESSLTTPCMVWRQISAVGNHPLVNSEAPPQGTLAHAASVYIPPTGYNTGYYSLFDHACDNAGPFNTGDSASSRKFAGGAYIDLDRTKLGASENVLLHLKFIPLTEQQVRPDGSRYTGAERAVLNIHLVTTGQTENSILSVPQPRHFQYANPPSQIPAPYPEVDRAFSVFARPDGMLREEQLLIPLSSYPTANRIRIERESGSAILIDAALIRLGRP